VKELIVWASDESAAGVEPEILELAERAEGNVAVFVRVPAATNRDRFPINCRAGRSPV
jgi:hypothetical protein